MPEAEDRFYKFGCQEAAYAARRRLADECRSGCRAIPPAFIAESVQADTGRQATVDGVGACGAGDNFGVLGMTFLSPGQPGIAGLYAQHNRNGVGAIGATMHGGIGIVGMSLENLGNPLATFAPPQAPLPPSPAPGGAGAGRRVRHRSAGHQPEI